MANQPIATIVAVTGKAFARNENMELRALKAGDTLREGETVITSADGRVELSFIDGSTMEVVADQAILMAADLFESGRPDASESALADTTTEQILQALAEGRDIDTALEAPAAGTEGGGEGEGNNFVRLLRIAEDVDPLAFEFEGTSGTEAPTFEEGLIVEEEALVPPTVSVAVGVEVQVPPGENPPGEPTSEFPVVVNGNAVSILEGSDGGSRQVAFTITLDRVFDQDVTVTYELRSTSDNGAADYPADWFDGGPGPFTVTIPAGQQSFEVVVNIVEDRIVEENGTFEIVLIDAVNATINQDSSTATVTIFDDDHAPVAQNDFRETPEGQVVITGSVIANDSDADGDALSVVAGTYQGSLGGTLVLAADGSYVYTSPVSVNNQNGNPTETFTYTVTDGANQPISADLVITITDTGATGGEATETVAEGASINVTVPAGSSLDAPMSVVDGTYTGSLGTVVTVTDGVFSYTAPVRDHADETADVETFSVGVVDSDGSPATSTIAITITDTIPTITATTNGVVDNEAGLKVNGTIDASAVDGIDHFDLSSSVAPTGLTYSFSPDGSTLTATDSTDEVVFTLSVNPDGTYEYLLIKPAPEAVAITPDFETLDIPNHATSYTLTLYASYDANGFGIGEQLGTVTFATTTSWLSVSQDGLGVQNNLMNTGEKLWMAFDTPVTNASFAIGNFSTSDALVWKVYAADGTTILDSGTISGSFYDTNGNLVNVANNESANYSIDLAANGLDDGLQFSSMTIESSNGAYKFTGFSVEKALTVEDQTHNFNVVAIDGDGSISNTGSFSVTIDGTGNTLTGTTSNDYIVGGADDDILIGGAGDDILIGGTGNDILTGGEGADTFKWSLGDAGTVQSPALDVVTDFNKGSGSHNAAEGDKLDLSDLLKDAGITADNLENYLHFEQNGNNTVVHISTTGSFQEGNFADANQIIQLNDVSADSLTTDITNLIITQTGG